MEDGIEQHRSMLLDKVEKVEKVEKMEKMEKYMFFSIESILKENFVTFDANEAISFCLKNKCKIEIFYLDSLKGIFVSSNAFITPPQLPA
jgi:hypothetical protein